MAELYRITKSGKVLIEDAKLVHIGQNLNDTSRPTTRRLRVELERPNGTKISFILYKSEVDFLIKEIYNWNLKAV